MRGTCLGLLILSLIICSSCKHSVKLSANELDWDKPIECNYQEGQDIRNDPDKGKEKYIFKNVHNSEKLTWWFYDLTTDSPKYTAAVNADIQSLHPVRGSAIEGLSIQIPQKNGHNSFVIWKDGVSFWNKINDIFGYRATQQFLGLCHNVEK